MNKKHKRIVLPVCILIGALLAVAIGAAAFYNQYLFYGELGALVLILLYLAFHLHQVKNDTSRYLAYVAHHLSQEEQDSLSTFPMPVAVSSANGEVIWYNDRFRDEVLDGGEVIGEFVGGITDGCTLADLQKKRTIDVRLGGRRYNVASALYLCGTPGLLSSITWTIPASSIRRRSTPPAVPAVMVAYIDNLEELMQDVRDSEPGPDAPDKVENLLEDGSAKPPASCANAAPISI